MPSTIVTWVAPMILLGLTISIMWHGFNLMRGAGGHHHTLDLFAHSMRAFLVMSLALAGGAYDANIVGFAKELRTDLANLLSMAPPGTNSYDALDQALFKAANTMQKMMPWVFDNTNILMGNFAGLIGLAGMGFMVGCIAVYAALICGEFILIDFALGILFAVGPLFVACFAFQATARFFDGWLGGVMKYTLTAVVMSAVLGIGLGLLNQYTTSIAQHSDTMDFIGSTVAALASIVALIMITRRVPEIAGNIVGGIGISVLGPAAAKAPLAAISSAMKGTARGAANAGAYAGGALSQTRAGQAVGKAVERLSETSIGERSLAMMQSAGRFSSATMNMQEGSVANAYRLGARQDAGIGVVTGHQRPMGGAGAWTTPAIDVMSGLPKAPPPAPPPPGA
ncbi:type IV secretion system protein [Ramlibacter sp.]|uniref:type IV secretion system protein n=1 Tax=Ramlibacter sp. TaxID=1917967 RepID=UPI002D801370|nr:type IV secretion system protein [Ramlibacter sp.]